MLVNHLELTSVLLYFIVAILRFSTEGVYKYDDCLPNNVLNFVHKLKLFLVTIADGSVTSSNYKYSMLSTSL